MEVADRTDVRYSCTLCESFSATSYASVLRHIGAAHSHDPNFSVECGVDGCSRSYVNYTSFRKHLKRKHSEILESRQRESDVGSLSDDVGPSASIEQHGSSVCDAHQRALFLLKSREVHKISQMALNDIIADFTLMTKAVLEDVQRRVQSALVANSISPSDIIGLNDIFEDAELKDPFHSLLTEHLQTKYYREHMGLVEPEEIILDSREMVRQHRGSRSRMMFSKKCMYYIPLLKSLRSLLENKFILQEIQSAHERSDGRMEDYCDGAAYRGHPLFSTERRALQIILYYDDLEICNPLGSKAKVHKLGIFYYMLGNIRPRYRSSLKCIQLLCVLKASYIQKLGINVVLQPFMEELKLLEQDGGVLLKINGEEHAFRGTVTVATADHLASQLLGGYKSLASALRKCRFCMAVGSDMESKFRTEEFQPRTRETHASHIEQLEGPLHNHVSTTYRIHCNSVLNSSRYFHVTEGLVMDVMHDILEGTLQYEVKELLKYLTSRGICTLHHINCKIKSFPYGFSEVVNKPSEITADHLSSNDHKLRQNASQMWCLGRLLPLMLGEDVPLGDQHWECFLLMLTIVDYVFAPVISNDDIPYLKDLIQEHHEMFREVYPLCPVIPKMHYMIHLPEWTEKCGPVSRLWCMRLEAKHSYFKMLAHRVRNFRNIPKTLAGRHQRMMCYYLHHPHSSPLLKDMKTVKGTLVNIDGYAFQDVLTSFNSSITRTTRLQSVKSVTVSGTTYRPGGVLVKDSALTPDFVEIVDILLIGADSLCVFMCKRFITDCYNHHFHAFEVAQSEEVVVVEQSSLFDFHVLSQYKLRTHPDVVFISMKYHIVENV